LACGVVVRGCLLLTLMLGGPRPQRGPRSGPAYPLLLGPGDAVEVDRRVNAAGTVGVASQQVPIGLPLAGQTLTLRLEAATMHVLADGVLVRSLPSPVPVGSRARLHGARLARGVLVVPLGPVVVRRRASLRGQIQVAGERVQVGLTRARQVVTVHVAGREFRVFDEGGHIKVIPRRDRQEVTRFKHTSNTSHMATARSTRERVNHQLKLIRQATLELDNSKDQQRRSGTLACCSFTRVPLPRCAGRAGQAALSTAVWKFVRG
jgi:hypothetical protein